jgi:hypothetical protein
MDTIKLPIGVSDFRELRKGEFYYIDKSQFIPELINSSSLVTLIPRPRRFGKTLNMTMLQSWFEKLPEGGTHTHLLDGLKADITPGEHHALRGKIPVVFLSFKDVKETTAAEVIRKITEVVQAETIRLSPWWEDAPIEIQFRRKLDSLRDGVPTSAELSMSLQTITHVLAKVSGHPPLVLIDEYDTPITSGVEHGFFTEVVNFFRNFLSAGLKDNSFIWKGVLTGILQVSKENLFSGLNNIVVLPLVETDLDSCFGLLEDEVQKLLSDFGLIDKIDEVREWYNGYLFGANQIYNPWSLISYVSRPHTGFQPFWVNTASTLLMGKAIAGSNGILRDEIEVLIQQGSVQTSIDQHVQYHEEGIRPDDIWSFFLFTGYLTPAIPTHLDESGQHVAQLKIPNKEVLVAYQKLVTDWTKEKLGSSEAVTDMLTGLITGDEELFVPEFNKLIETVLSTHDVTRRTSESFYHAFVTGMLVQLNATHLIRSNRESGRGRYDVMVEPRDKSRYPGVIIEFKVVPAKGSLEETLESAHQQIVEKRYAADLRQAGCREVIQWGIVFRGKESLISVREG